MECTNCGMTLRRAMLLALMQDAGAKCYPDALTCDGEHEHDFRAPAAVPVVAKES